MAGKPMREILGDRACEHHADAPMPCCQCAGIAQSSRDRAKGGFRGPQARFEESDTSSNSREITEAESNASAAVRATISQWGLRKQLEGQSAFV